MAYYEYHDPTLGAATAGISYRQSMHDPQPRPDKEGGSKGDHPPYTSEGRPIRGPPRRTPRTHNDPVRGPMHSRNTILSKKQQLFNAMMYEKNRKILEAVKAAAMTAFESTYHDSNKDTMLTLFDEMLTLMMNGGISAKIIKKEYEQAILTFTDEMVAFIPAVYGVKLFAGGRDPTHSRLVINIDEGGSVTRALSVSARNGIKIRQYSDNEAVDAVVNTIKAVAAALGVTVR